MYVSRTRLFWLKIGTEKNKNFFFILTIFVEFSKFLKFSMKDIRTIKFYELLNFDFPILNIHKAFSAKKPKSRRHYPR